MAEISPFAGLRFATDRVGDLATVLCPPYDVIDEDERRELEARHPENVVRLELPRGDGRRALHDGRAPADVVDDGRHR